MPARIYGAWPLAVYIALSESLCALAQGMCATNSANTRVKHQVLKAYVANGPAETTSHSIAEETPGPMKRLATNPAPVTQDRVGPKDCIYQAHTSVLLARTESYKQVRMIPYSHLENSSLGSTSGRTFT